MKELSIEQKAARYNEALETARKINSGEPINVSDGTPIPIAIFPELKESRDKRVKETIIKYFKERQKDADDDELFCGLTYYDILDWLKHGMDIPEDTKQELEDNLNKALEKETPKSWNKFLDDQKPTDKVEPKFHEGDWVVYKNDICKIVKREEGCNKLVTNFGIEKELVNERNLSTARLWTIQDARDGDMLYSPSLSLLWIFKSRDTVYCGCNLNYNDGAFCGEGYFERPTDAIPATKEQRDLLFSKMKDAGYEWDADKKELKKIEQEEDVELTDFESALFTAFSDAWQSYLLGEKVNVEKWAKEHSTELLEVAKEQKAAWSEEDERLRTSCIKHIEEELREIRNDKYGHSEIISDLKESCRERITWLKSLKERYTWKPSDKQMKAIEHICDGCFNVDLDILDSIYKDFKKLREE